MIHPVIGTKTKDVPINRLISEFSQIPAEGTLYVGYPILSTADGPIFLDALLVSDQHGVVVFDLLDDLPSAEDPEFWKALEARQNELYVAVRTKLITHKTLRCGRDLAVPLTVLTYGFCQWMPPVDFEVVLVQPGELAAELAALPPVEEEYRRPLNAAVQGVTTIKPPKKRLAVVKENSRGALLKRIEKEIANLDRWQKGAAIEFPDGPQRIRGLAGSGKTIVLALKAAYLHARYPEWNIGLTFHTRSLYQQFQDLVRRFCYEHINDEPDWSKLRILHSWGSQSQPGLYSEMAQRHGLQPQDFSSAKAKYGNQAFGGICQELVSHIHTVGPNPLFDVLLIDEAQDFPQPFFQLAYLATTDAKRIVWAYDELQNLSDFMMSPPSELFGADNRNRPLIELRNREGEAQQDIILPVCYRNTPWALATAHAIGFGIYRHGGIIQFFDDGGLWTKIGYEIKNGSLLAGRSVTLARAANASPAYFAELLDPRDAVQCKVFANPQEQAEWVAQSIVTNLTVDELETSDILIIMPNPLTVMKDASFVINALQRAGIDSHIAGVTSSVDKLFIDSSIAVTGIFRAKGNEAPMVYVLDSQYGFDGYELIKRRNTLFTAITRSRAWVRVCGWGQQMEQLKGEIDAVSRQDFHLEFRVPTNEELAKMRKIHRDMTPEEQAQIKNVQQGLAKALALFESGHFSLENMPREIQERLKRLIQEDGE